MRTLSDSLAAAQKTRSARPALRLMLDDRHCGAPRYHFTKVAGDSNLASYHTAAVTWGPYLGLLTHSEDGVPVFYRYLAGPNPGSPLIRALSAVIETDCQLTLIHDGTTLWAFQITSYRHLYYATSTDDGDSWSSWQLFYSFPAGTEVKSLAAASGAGTYCTWVLLCDTLSSGTYTINTFYRIGTTIYGPYAWPRSGLTAPRGLAAHYLNGDPTFTQVVFFLAGQSEGSPMETIRRYTLQVSTSRLWTYTGPCIAGDHPNFSWAWPSVVSNDALDRTFLLAQETSPASTYPVLISIRPQVTFMGARAATRRPLPPLGSATLGIALESTGLQYGNPSALYHAPAYQPADRIDLSPYLLSYRFTEGLPPYTASDRGTFVLGSHDSYLDHPSVLTPGAQLMLEEGYVTSSGLEYSQLPPQYIHSVTRSPHQTIIRTYDTWGKLTRQLADFSITLSDSPANDLDFLCHLIGIAYFDDGSPNLYGGGWPPFFVLVHSQPLASLATRVLLYTGCAILFDSPSPASWPSVRMYAFTPTTSTSGAYQFGPDSHPVLEWTLDDADPLGNWFIALFESDYGEAFDLDQINALGFPSQVSAYDSNWSPGSAILPADAAAIMRTFYQHRQHQGTITTRPHVAAQPGDVVHVDADPLTGYRRILAIAHAYDAHKAIYTHTYTLGALPSP